MGHQVREPFNNYLAHFFRKGGPPQNPSAENHFSKKTLAEMGGTPPLTESLLSFSVFFSLKRIRMMFLYYIRLIMDQKGHKIDQKGLKMYEIRQKKGVFGPEIPAF